jgi:hypothetical protein
MVRNPLQHLPKASKFISQERLCSFCLTAMNCARSCALNIEVSKRPHVSSLVSSLIPKWQSQSIIRHKETCRIWDRRKERTKKEGKTDKKNYKRQKVDRGKIKINTRKKIQKTERKKESWCSSVKLLRLNAQYCVSKFPIALIIGRNVVWKLPLKETLDYY